jgi:formylglycine-generating enzyme required for sulfatase activity
MHGNVWEWTEDRWIETNDGKPRDGSERGGSAHRSVRVIRGGSWRCTLLELRAAHRRSYPSYHYKHDPGFRVARNLLP